MKHLCVLPRVALILLSISLCSACLDRPIGEPQPKTTNIIMERLIRSSVNKIDMLFVIDNSLSMGDKQAILAKALPDLLDRLVSPACVNGQQEIVAHPKSASDECPSMSAREFQPVTDIHVGVITSSLGGYGAEFDCIENDEPYSSQKVDMAHLVPSLDRWSGPDLPGGFMRWTSASNTSDFAKQFEMMVTSAGEYGCGWEAPLEAWYRFLIEPKPYTKLVRQPCGPSDNGKACVGPQLDANGAPLIDQELLRQRAAFLRPDSLVAVVMLSDENDCSFKASGQSWMLSTAHADKRTAARARRATAACQSDPNDRCCHTCGVAVPQGCPVTSSPLVEEDVAQGCENGDFYDGVVPDGSGDAVNLRCFEQKRRFGFDHLYPIKRYSHALQSPTLCLAADDLDPSSQRCSPQQLVENPLFDDLSYPARLALDPSASRAPPRNLGRIFLAGIIGVPWQDLAISADPANELVYRSAQAPKNATDLSSAIDWSWLLKTRNQDGSTAGALDPIMHEQISPRTGRNPATGEALSPPDGARLSNSINGHERNIPGDDLQYACVFPLEQPQLCATPGEVQDATNNNITLPSCDCSAADLDIEKNPLCQQPDGSYGREQRFGKAYPGIRQLEVLKEFGENAIVASICPKQTGDINANDFGYRPAITTIVDRLKAGLSEKCMGRELVADDDGLAKCKVVEVQPPDVATQVPCDSQKARASVPDKTRTELHKRLRRWKMCKTETECAAFQLCAIQRLGAEQPAELHSCQNDANSLGDGWCYIDPARGIGNAELVSGCAETERRKIRFVGAGNPANDRPTILACAGLAYEPIAQSVN